MNPTAAALRKRAAPWPASTLPRAGLWRPSEFFLTAGTSEAYTLAFSTLADAGDAVLLPRPGYPLFEHLAGHARLEAAYYDQTWATGWKPDAASLEQGALAPDEIRRRHQSQQPHPDRPYRPPISPVAEFCLRNDAVLVVDEVFDAVLGRPREASPGRALFPEVKTTA